MSDFSPNVLRILTSGASHADMVAEIMSIVGFNESKALGVVHGFVGLNDPIVGRQDTYQSGRLIGAKYLDTVNAMRGGLDKSE